MTYATRDDFLKPVPLKSVEVKTDLGTVRLTQLTQSETARFHLWSRPDGEPDQEREQNRNLKLLTLCAVDEAGERLFQESDIETLGNQPAAIISDLIFQCMKINGFIEDIETGEPDLLGK